MNNENSSRRSNIEGHGASGPPAEVSLRKQASTIAVVNHKGGVGKTTTSVNMAAGFALHGFRTLVIDLDPQASATRILGIDLEGFPPSTPTIASALLDESIDLRRVVMPTAQPNLHVVPSDLTLAQVSALLHARHFREHVLHRALAKIKSEFDFIVLDCPPSLDVLAVNAIVAADKLLIPCELSGNALHALSDLLTTVTTFKPANDLTYRILVTNVTGYAADRQTHALGILAPIGDKLLTTQIRRTESIQRSQMPAGDGGTITPLILRPERSRGKQDYRAAVKEVLSIWA